jgi:hypothetical protein
MILSVQTQRTRMNSGTTHSEVDNRLTAMDYAAGRLIDSFGSAPR